MESLRVAEDGEGRAVVEAGCDATEGLPRSMWGRLPWAAGGRGGGGGDWSAVRMNVLESVLHTHPVLVKGVLKQLRWALSDEDFAELLLQQSLQVRVKLGGHADAELFGPLEAAFTRLDPEVYAAALELSSHVLPPAELRALLCAPLRPRVVVGPKLEERRVRCVPRRVPRFPVARSRLLQAAPWVAARRGARGQGQAAGQVQFCGSQALRRRQGAHSCPLRQPHRPVTRETLRAQPHAGQEDAGAALAPQYRGATPASPVPRAVANCPFPRRWQRRRMGCGERTRLAGSACSKRSGSRCRRSSTAVPASLSWPRTSLPARMWGAPPRSTPCSMVRRLG